MNNLYAGEIAAVSIELHTVMAGENDNEWPENNRYTVFGGYSGWWDFCGNAGLEFAKIVLNEEHSETVEDYYCNIIDTYIISIWSYIYDSGRLSYPSPEKLSDMAVLALKSA